MGTERLLTDIWVLGFPSQEALTSLWPRIGEQTGEYLGRILGSSQESEEQSLETLTTCVLSQNEVTHIWVKDQCFLSLLFVFVLPLNTGILQYVLLHLPTLYSLPRLII